MSIRHELKQELISLLKETMKKTGHTTAKLASKIGVDPRTVSKWKSGDTFSIDGIDAAFAAMGCVILTQCLSYEDFLRVHRKPLAQELGYKGEEENG